MTDKSAGRNENDEESAGDRTVKSATEARQGEIVLGRYSHLIWIVSIVVIVVLALVFWGL